MKYLRIYLAACILMLSLSLQAQTKTDSLTLPWILDAVLKNYPELKKVENELNASDAKIALTKSSKLPDVVFSAGYNRLGPVSSFNLGGRQVQMMPDNMYNATFSITENLLDFGKTNKNMAIDEKNKEIQQLSIHQVRQRLSLAVMGNYYTICYLQEAIRIKDEQLNTLNQHLQFVQKKAATGSATQYDLLSTKVRITTVENQKIDLQTALEIQGSWLNGYLGVDQKSGFLLKSEALVLTSIPSLDDLCQQAFTNRQEMKVALQKSELVKLKLDAIHVQNNPTVNLQAAGGFKNGYFNSNMEDIGKLNFNVGIGVRVPIFDANRSKYAVVQANTNLTSSDQEVELLRRSISNEVVEARANVLAAFKKIHQCELQVQLATQAYQLAETSYKNGVITNLDLMDSYTARSESSLGLFKAKTDYQVNLKKLKLATGEDLL